MSASTFLAGSPAGQSPASSRVVWLANGAAATVNTADAQITTQSIVTATAIGADATAGALIVTLTAGNIALISTGNIATAAPGLAVRVSVEKY